METFPYTLKLFLETNWKRMCLEYEATHMDKNLFYENTSMHKAYKSKKTHLICQVLVQKNVPRILATFIKRQFIVCNSDCNIIRACTLESPNLARLICEISRTKNLLRRTLVSNCRRKFSRQVKRHTLLPDVCLVPTWLLDG